MSYRISLDEIDGCLYVTDGKRTVKVERFATDGIREVYGHTVELLDRENAKLRKELESVGTAAYLYERNDLKYENAKLREDLEFERSENGWVREFLDRMGHKCGTKDCPSLVAYVTKLESENDKLRELVLDMYSCISHANEQDWFYFERDKFGCGMSCTVNGEACGLCALADRMKELGIEVAE